MIATCEDTTVLGSFLENHDMPRFPSYTSDMSLTKNAIAFTMLGDGIPILYQGQEQLLAGASVPENREAIWLTGYPTGAGTLYKFVATLNAVRKLAIGEDEEYATSNAVPVYSDSHTIVMRKGSNGTQIVSVLTNMGASGNASFNLVASKSGFAAGDAVTNVFDCRTYTTDSKGSLAITITSGLPLVLYPTANLYGSGICDGNVSSAPGESLQPLFGSFHIPQGY